MEIDEDMTFLRDCLDTFYFHTDSPLVALDRYKITFEIEKQRYGNDPDDVIAKNRLSVVYLDLAKTYNVLNEQELAFDCIKEAIQLGRELCKKYPDNPDFKSNLAIAHWMLGDLNYKLDKYQAARGDYKAAERLWAELVTIFPDHAEFNENSEKMLTRIEKLRGVGSIKEKTFELLSTIYDYLTRGRYR
jgi:tetratricopeptide (TPR) repeat protein